MASLSQGRFDTCLETLRKIETLLKRGGYNNTDALRILTLNNFGCCYRRCGKLHLALQYLTQAALLGSTTATHASNLSITHLNICAISSQLGKHEKALEHAHAAVFHCQELMVSEANIFGEKTEQVELKNRGEKLVTLAIAYHNLAVELEFTGKLETCLQVNAYFK